MQQQQFQVPRHSMKNLALWMFALSWITGVLGAMCTVSVFLLCIGLPLLIAALAMHIVGFIALAQVRECP